MSDVRSDSKDRDSQTHEKAKPQSQEAAPPTAGGAPADPADPLGDELAEAVLSDFEILAAERDDYYDQLLRTRADFDNFRKRMIKQQTEHLERANEGLIGKLLEVLDVLDGATAHGEGFEQVGPAWWACWRRRASSASTPWVGSSTPTRPMPSPTSPRPPATGDPVAPRWCPPCSAPATAGRVGSCGRRW